jgi:hypothetical protein
MNYKEWYKFFFNQFHHRNALTEKPWNSRFIKVPDESNIFYNNI